jgi:integrase
MSVRRRQWRAPDGAVREAWVVDYFDQRRTRHIKTFARKRDADAYHARVTVDVATGTHTAPRSSPTVAEAGRRWLAGCEASGLERSTLQSYEEILRLHLNPELGDVRLAQLTVPAVRDFEDGLRQRRSAAMVRKIRVALGSLLADAQERGQVAQNVVRSLRRKKERHVAARQKRKLKIGVDIPSPDEVRAIIAALDGRWRPLFLTVIFTGLRSSEMRGLRWPDVDLKRGEIHVRQRADRYNAMGPPKSHAGERTIPVPPMVVNALREWKLQSQNELVFPSKRGGIVGHSNTVTFGFKPIQVAAGVVDKHGRAKYGGLHSLRHFYASWCINRHVDGGLELPLKLVQARLGHASIQMTADTYGHLFPRGDDGAELAEAEKAFLG